MEKTYQFRHIEVCNMCGGGTSKAKILGMRLDRSQGVNPKAKIGVAVGVVQCSDCGLIFSQPTPIPASIDDHYGIPPETYWRGHYFTVEPDYLGIQISTAKRLLDFTPGMRALDIGAGLGKAMAALERSGFEAWGVEPSAPFRNKALELSNISAERLQNAKIEDAVYEESFFDFVTFGAVLEHLYDPASSIETAMRWLRPGGIIHIEVPSSNHFMAKLFNVYFRLRGTNYVTNLSPMHPPFHLYEFSLESFRQHAARAGYSIAHHYFDVASIHRIPRFLHPIARAWMKRNDSGMQLTVYLRKPG